MFFLTLFAIASSIACPYWIQSELFVGLLTMAVGTLTNPSLFVLLIDASPKFTKFWIWSDDSITPKVHPTGLVDVNPRMICDFATNYFTENSSRTCIFCKKFINGSFDFLGVAAPLSTKGPYWIDNLLCPCLYLGVGGTVDNLNWEIQHCGRYGGADVLWRGAVPTCLAYLPRSSENARATARRVHDDII